MSAASSRGGKKMWCVPELDAQYIERMEDILDLYSQPYNFDEPVVCLDEKPVQLLADIADVALDGKDGSTWRDYEYRRQGKANVFVAVESKASRPKHMLKVTRCRKKPDFARMLRDIASRYPKARTIHLVMDNLNTHTEKSLAETFGKQVGTKLWNRFTAHFTPKHASWLNQAEAEIGIYSRQCLGKRRMNSLEELRVETNAWKKWANKSKLSINWAFTTADAREVFKY
jgi:transposase